MYHISFAHPWILIFIPLVLLLWYVFFREHIGYIPPNSLILIHKKIPKHIIILWVIRCCMVSCLTMILAGTSIHYTGEKQVPLSQDVMVIFDVSLSMLAEDVQPNRITVAKNAVKTFIESRKKDRVGLIIFAGKPFVSIPFSYDYNGILSIASGLSPYMIRQELPGLSGTNIGDAILLANMTFSGSSTSATKKSIILLTDGKANTGIDPELATIESKNMNITIYTVGFGSLSGAELSYTEGGEKKYFYDASGNKLRSDIDEGILRRIAKETNGQYFYGNTQQELEQVFKGIDSTLTTQGDKKIQTSETDIFPILITILSICVILERWVVYLLIRRCIQVGK